MLIRRIFGVQATSILHVDNSRFLSVTWTLTSSFDMNNSDGTASLKQQKSPDVATATIKQYRTCHESVGGVVYGEPKNQTWRRW